MNEKKLNLEQRIREKRGPLLTSFPQDVVCKFEDILGLFMLDDLTLEDIRVIPELAEFKETAKIIQKSMNRGEAELYSCSNKMRDKLLDIQLGQNWRKPFKKRLFGFEDPFIKEYFLEGMCDTCKNIVVSKPFHLDAELESMAQGSEFLLATQVEDIHPVLCETQNCINYGGIAPVVASYYIQRPSLKFLKEFDEVPFELVKLRVKAAFSIAVKSMLTYLSENEKKKIMEGKESHKILDEFIALNELKAITDTYANTLVVSEEEHLVPAINMISQEKIEWKEKPGVARNYLYSQKPGSHQDYRSYHTIVERNGVEISVQIRTRRMHEVNERGAADHSMYKRKQYENLCKLLNNAPDVVEGLKKIFKGKNI